MLVELNIDALVGPTHIYGGIGVGNIASALHRGHRSRPRQAALEGLAKARLVASLGIPQYLLKPPLRPQTDFLAKLGFTGSPSEQLTAAAQEEPAAHTTAVSSAFMWAANAATFSPSVDCADGRNHLTVANLISSWHRSLEHSDRFRQLKEMFATLQPGETFSTEVHPALPPSVPMRDEGAANHMRLSNKSGCSSLNLFVYGAAENLARHTSNTADHPTRFLARQTLAASRAVARLHQLDPKRTFFLQQHPDAIDAGVFHNDVIATSHQRVLLYHELAYLDAEAELNRIEGSFLSFCGEPLIRICVPKNDMSLDEAVASYFFNSQLLTPQADHADKNHRDQPRMILLCPKQCSEMTRVRSMIERLVADASNPIDQVHYVSLRESMMGGGGPACMRLRVQLPETVVPLFAPKCRWTPRLDDQLRELFENLYPDSYSSDELGSPESLTQCAEAYAALDRVLGA